MKLSYHKTPKALAGLGALTFLSLILVTAKIAPQLLQSSMNLWVSICLENDAQRLSEAANQYYAVNEVEEAHLSEIIGPQKMLYSLHFAITCPNETLVRTGYFKLQHKSGETRTFYVKDGKPLSPYDLRMAEESAKTPPNATALAVINDWRSL